MMSNKKATLTNVSMGIKEGVLNLCHKGALKKSKSTYALLMANSQSGVARLEVYEDLKHSLTKKPSFMVVGSDVVKVERVTPAPKEMRNAFLISTRDQHYQFFVPSSLECDEWCKHIQETLLTEVHVPNSPKDKNTISEVNEIYESFDKVSSQAVEFFVKIDETTRAKMGVDGMVRLVVENDSITIITISGKMIVRWALKDLRKFSYQNQTFLVEAGRKSSLGEGNFVFLTDEGKKISAAIDMRKRELKQKLETAHCAGPESLPVPGHPSASKPRSPVQPPTCAELHPSYWENTGIYDTLENVLPAPNTKPSWGHAGNVYPPQKVPPVETKSESLAKPVSLYSSTKNTKSPLTSQSISSSVKQNFTKVGTNDDTLKHGQEEIYSEPEIKENAWKTHAYDDNEDMGIYSNLNFSHQKEVEDHYWRGSDVLPRVDAKHEKKENVQVEDIYAEVDFSKKSRNKK